MTDFQRITLRQSEVRSRLRELLAVETRTTEQATEFDALTAEASSLEVEYRAAILSDPQPAGDPADPSALDAETRERINLRGRASLGAFLLAALRGREADGAEAEYRSSCGVGVGIPIDLFERDRPAPAAEARAATPSPATGTGVTVAPIQPFVYAPSIAARLGIDLPSVGSGAYSEMTISTSLPAGPRATGVALAATAAALTPTTAKPRRIGARLTLALEDVAAVGQANFEAALRANVSMALSDSLDSQIIAGNGTSPNIEGLIDQLTDPTDPTAVAAFDDFVAAFADQVDGLWAGRPSEVSIVANVDAYKLSAKTFRDGTGGQSRAGERAFSDYAQEHYGGWWTNKRMPASASTIARGIVYRMGQMGIRTACLPQWGSITVDDVYSNAGEGQRHFVMSSLVGDKVLLVQPDAYGLVEFKVA